MPLPAKKFLEWTEALEDGMNVARIADLSGTKRTTLHGQLFRGHVPEQNVIAIARSLSLDPLVELSSFEQYGQVADESYPPTAGELLSQIHYTDVLGEIIRRGQLLPRSDGDLLRDFPFTDSIRSWIDAVDPGRMRSHLASTAGISEAAISSQLTLNRLSPKVAVEAATFAGVSRASGLVVIGLLTEAEGRWPANARVNALLAVDAVQLVDLASYWLSTLRRSASLLAKDREVVDSLWEHPG